MTQMQIGRYYQKRLEVGIALLINNHELMLDKVSKSFITFPELEMNWPEIKQTKDLSDAKTLFRLANTQFKKALEYYQLDGFVTEHVQIKQGISMCYKLLIKIEPDNARAVMMHQRRLESLEFMQKELNPNTY